MGIKEFGNSEYRKVKYTYFISFTCSLNNTYVNEGTVLTLDEKLNNLENIENLRNYLAEINKATKVNINNFILIKVEEEIDGKFVDVTP